MLISTYCQLRHDTMTVALTVWRNEGFENKPIRQVTNLRTGLLNNKIQRKNYTKDCKIQYFIHNFYCDTQVPLNEIKNNQKNYCTNERNNKPTTPTILWYLKHSSVVRDALNELSNNFEIFKSSIVDHHFTTLQFEGSFLSPISLQSYIWTLFNISSGDELHTANKLLFFIFKLYILRKNN